MILDPTLLVESGAAALLFAAVFLAGGRILAFQHVIDDPHIVTSFGAGMSSAYVFVHVLPELTGLREVVEHTVMFPLPHHGALVYFVALIGFLAFYAVNEISMQGRSAPQKRVAFRISVGGFAVYVWLVSYLLIRGLEHGAKAEGAYAAALSVHFLSVDNSLHEQHGLRYDRIGRWLLAAMAVAGWLSGVAFKFDERTIAMLMSFVAGGVIVNSTIEELPGENHGRLVPFIGGGLIYGAILLTFI